MYVSRLVFTLLFGAFVIAFAAPSEAAVIITVEDATIQPGGTANLNVYIRSNNPLDALNEFGFEFRITGGPRRLEFVDPQSDLQLFDPAYIFAGDSAGEDGLLVPGVGDVGPDFINDTYIGGDFTTSGDDTPPFPADKLLVVLELTANTVLPPINGDTFTVELITDINTFFLGTNGPLEIDPSSDLSGTVTVEASAAVVPEPSTLALFSGMAGLALVRYRRKRS
jgi:hypothetical protein